MCSYSTHSQTAGELEREGRENEDGEGGGDREEGSRDTASAALFVKQSRASLPLPRMLCQASLHAYWLLFTRV